MIGKPDVSTEMKVVNLEFPLGQLPSLKDYLALKVQEEDSVG